MAIRPGKATSDASTAKRCTTCPSSTSPTPPTSSSSWTSPPPSPPVPKESLLRTLWYCVLLFGPVLCGVMFEDIIAYVRSWWEGSNHVGDVSNWTSTTPTPGVVDVGDTTLVAKVTAMAVLGLASLTLGLLPLKLAVWLGWNSNGNGRASTAAGTAEALHSHGGKNGGALLSSMLCFGGGVLMFTTFAHMLPEVTETLNELESEGAISGSLAHIAPHMLMCAGFFIMYLVEELVHMYLHWRSNGGHHGHSHGDHGHSHSHSHVDNRNNSVIHNNLINAYETSDIKTSPIKSVKWSSRDCKPSTVVLQYTDGSEVKSEVPNEFFVSAVTFSTPWGLSGNLPAEKQFLRVDVERPCCKGEPRLQRVSAKSHKSFHDHNLEPVFTMPNSTPGDSHHSHAVPVSGVPATGDDADPEVVEDAVVSALRGLLIVLGLSVHELFEGLAVGLEGSASNVWYMLVAVACHKLVIAFCIGVELVAMRTKVSLHVLYVGTFAIVSPLGIGIGILVTSNYREVEGGVVPAFLQGIATGTLLYVVFFEILERQRANKQSGLRQYIAVLTGFLVMFGISFIGEHEHHHHHHHHDHDHDASTLEHMLKATNYTVLHTE